MADPRTGRFTLFNAITATTTTELHTVAGNQGQYFASSIIFEVVGSATPSWTLAFQGKSVPGGTYTALDYIQIWQAGAAAPSTSSLTVNDTTVRFYLVPNAPQFVQAVATRTTGTLTVYFSYTSMPFTQLLSADSSGNQQVVIRSGASALKPLAAMPGASEVKVVGGASVAPSTTRLTFITPTAGKKIRVLAVMIASESVTLTNFEVYFGTGANIGTTWANAIYYNKCDNTVNGGKTIVFPDGAGPVGAADAVVSFRTGVDITTNGNLVVLYREE